MSVFEDARRGVLVGEKLRSCVRANPKILNQKDPASGLTLLALAVVNGHPDEVRELLKRGAKADAPCKKGETPLLLAAWKTTKERPLIIQLLLEKTPRRSIDTTCGEARNMTPLMYVVEKNDVESVRLLRKSGASIRIKNDDGFNAEEMAEEKDRAVLLALHPKKEQLQWRKWAQAPLNFLLYIIACLNAFTGYFQRVFSFNPESRRPLSPVRRHNSLDSL